MIFLLEQILEDVPTLACCVRMDRDTLARDGAVSVRHRIEVHPSVGEERLVHDELADAHTKCILLHLTERT